MVLKVLLSIVSFFVLWSTPLCASQSETDNIAQMSAVSLFNIDKTALLQNAKAYMGTNPKIKALKIIESLSGSTYVELMRNDKGIMVESPLPNDLSHLSFFKSDAMFNQEKVGAVYAYFESVIDLKLSKEELAWLSKNKKIKVTNEIDWPPYDFDVNGQASGYSIEYLQMLAKITGIELEFVKGTWSELLQKFENNEIDLIHVFNKTKERESNYLFTHFYLEPQYALAIRSEDATKYQKLDDLKTKIVACGKDWASTKIFKHKYPQINVKEYGNIKLMLKDLSYGKVDAVLDDLASVYYNIQTDKYINLKLGMEVNLFEESTDSNFYFATHKDKPYLQSILNKAMQNISREELGKLNQRWFGEKSDSEKAWTNLEFSDKEKAWLSRNTKMRFSEVTRKPFAFIENKKMTGILGDYLDIITKATGIEFELVPSSSWEEILEKFKNGELDFLPGIGGSKKELEMGVVSDMFASYPLVFVSDERITYIKSLDEIKDKIFALPKGYTSYSIIKSKFPDARIIETIDIEEALMLVENKKADVFMGHIVTALYYIEQLGRKNLKVSGEANIDYEHRLLINPKYPEFISIANKVFAKISQKEKEKIYHDWVYTELKQSFDYSIFYKVGFGLVVLFALFAYYNRKLSKMVAAKTSELRALLTSFDKHVIASKTDTKGIIIYASDAFCEISGYDRDELIGKSQNIIRHPDMPKEVFKELWTTIQTGNVWKGEIKNKKKNGDFYWTDAIIGPEYDSKGKLLGYSAIRQDITASKEVEELKENLEIKIVERTKELDDERNYINSVINSQNNFVISTNGEILKSANKSMFQFYNITSVDEFLEKYGHCICDTFNTSAPSEFIQKRMNGEKWIDYIYARQDQIHKVIITKDGTDYIFTITVEHFSFNEEVLSVAVFTDITELERAKKDVEKILENILLPVLITSQSERKILYANRYAEIQYETTLEEMVGSSIDNIYTTENQNKHIVEVLKVHGKVEKLEEVFQTKKGKQFTALLSVAPIRYKNQDAYIGMVADISEQKIIEQKVRALHRHTQSSIEYASLIQQALIPARELFEKHFKEYFTIWNPKDIVGGDMYLLSEIRSDDECLLMVIDCTGHGVPGAFVTMLVKAIERQIVANINNSSEDVSPALILSIFNKSMKHLLKQEDEESVSNAGFDGGILYYNKKEKIVKFSGAETALFYIDGDELITIKGDRHSIGYKKSDANFVFKEHVMEAKDGMQFYITTDGYLDQNGGDKGFPFGKKRFMTIIEENHTLPLADQQEVLLYEMMRYRKHEEKNDDVTIVGIKI